MLAVLGAVAVFAAAWVGIHFGFYADNHIIDTPVYQRYGDAMVGGNVPYRDFTVEYPPAALPTFVVPSLVADNGDRHTYDLVFDVIMGVCGAVLAGLVAVTLVADGAGKGRLVAGTMLAALAPLALGSVVLTRFDLWPAALIALAMALLVTRHELLAFGALGVGIAAKVFPVVLLPIFLASVWKRRGRRRALGALGICAAVVGAVVLPFFVLSPGGTWDSSLRQTARPLQIETLGSGFLLAAHQAFSLGITMKSSYGSQNLAGALPDALSIGQAVVEGLAIVAIWIWFARSPADRDRLFRACAAAVCAFVVFGKVLSPQFLIWLFPLVPLVRGRRGVAAGALLVIALVVTQLWFPYRYWELALDFSEFPSWLVFARNLVLVSLLVLLALAEPAMAEGQSLEQEARGSVTRLTRAAPRRMSLDRPARTRRRRLRFARRRLRAESAPAARFAFAGWRVRPARRSPSRAVRSCRHR